MNNIVKKVTVGVAITGGTVAFISTVPILLGFGTGGIVAGSVAAGIQSLIGNVAAGSLFASLTSLGMTGTLATVAGVGAAVGTAGAVATAASK